MIAAYWRHYHFVRGLRRTTKKTQWE